MTKQISSILTLGLLLTILSCSTIKNAKVSKDGEINPKINRDNYYDYNTKPGLYPISTNWIRRDEAVLVIIDELDKLGYKTSSYVLYELPDTNRIILDVYNREKNFGFVFNTGHFMEIKKEHRQIKVFNQSRFKSDGRLGKLEKYENLPRNIIALQETWYWYQYIDNNSGGELLNKATAIEILRQDIREAVKEFKKN